MDLTVKNQIENKLLNGLSNDCKRIMKILNDNEFQSYAVGGCVRDILLGNKPKDEDLTTNANPDEVMKLFRGMGFNVIETGLQHGTVTVMLNGTGYEITTYRIDGEYEDGRRPSEVIFTDDIKEDLKRRDFTINAMAYSLQDGFVDEFGGVEDLSEGKIKAVGNANERIDEDALRMMRAIRFSAKYGFDIDDELIEAIKKNKESIRNVSAERINDEICKLLVTKNPTYIKKMVDYGLMDEISPEISNMFRCEQNSPYHIYNVGDHTMKALENEPTGDLNTRLALLFHDIGKPVVKEEVEFNGSTKCKFKQHNIASKILTEDILRRLKFSNSDIKEILDLVFHHDEWMNTIDKNINKEVKYFIINNQSFDDIFYNKLMNIKRCDNMAQNQKNQVIVNEQFKHDKINEEINRILDIPHTSKNLAISGNEILDIEKLSKKGEIVSLKSIKDGKTRGMAIEILKKKMVEEIINNPENNNEEYLKLFCKRNLLSAIYEIPKTLETKQIMESEFDKIKHKCIEYVEALKEKQIEKLNEIEKET